MCPFWANALVWGAKMLRFEPLQSENATKCPTQKKEPQNVSLLGKWSSLGVEGMQSVQPSKKSLKMCHFWANNPVCGLRGRKISNPEKRASKCFTFGQMVQSGGQKVFNPKKRVSNCVTSGKLSSLGVEGTQSVHPREKSLKMCHFWAKFPVWEIRGHKVSNPEKRASKCVTFGHFKCSWHCSAKASQHPYNY